jgi:hypothetical protein
MYVSTASKAIYRGQWPCYFSMDNFEPDHGNPLPDRAGAAAIETGGGQTLTLEYVLFLSQSSKAKMILWTFPEENSYLTLTDEIGATSMDYSPCLQ